MFGGGTGGGSFGTQSQQAQGPTAAFGGRGGGFGGAAGRGFGTGSAGGAFSGKMLFGAPLPAAGQGSALTPAAGVGALGGEREARGGATGGGNQQQKQQQPRGALGPGRGVFARLGIAALREGASPDGVGGGSSAAGPTTTAHAAGGGRGRGGSSHGVPAGGRPGFGGAGSGRGGRGAGRGGGRQWHQHQEGRKYTWVAGAQAATAGGGGTVMEEAYDGDGGGEAGAPMDFDGSNVEIVYNEEADNGLGDGESVAVPRHWRAGRATAPPAGLSQPAAAGFAARVPVPAFNEKQGVADSGGAGTATDDDDIARLKRRQRRFGQTTDAAAAGGSKPGTTFGAASGGGDFTTARGASRSPVRWQSDAEVEPDARAHSPSPPPSPLPSPLLPYLGGTGGGDGMIDDDEGGAGSGAALVGTCELMCPVAERKRREASGELNIFERLDPQNSKLTTESLIIKKARKNYSEEDRRPENLRTFRALELTMARLRSLIAAPDENALAAAIQCTPEQTLLNVQAFLWDRYREVRKEIIAQHFHARADMLPKILAWNEEIARFLIISSHELWGNRDFAAQLNQEQLKKVLTDLVTRFYTSATRLGVPTPNSAEIKCYLLILMMGGTIEKNGRRFRQPAEAQMYLRQYSQEELASPWTSVLFGVMATLQTGNAVAFFDLMARAPYTLACICASHVMPMRSCSMHMMAAALGGPHPDQPGGRPNPDAAIPLSDLARVLKLSEANASSYAETRQALVQPGGASGQRDVSFLSPHLNSREPRAKSQHWISSKRSRMGRSQDTVNPAELSATLLSYCRLVLTGSHGSAMALPRTKGQLVPAGAAGASGLGSPIPAAAFTITSRQPPLAAAAGLQPTTLASASPTPWEMSPGAGTGSASSGKGLFGGNVGGTRRETIPSPLKTAHVVLGSLSQAVVASPSTTPALQPRFETLVSGAPPATSPPVASTSGGLGIGESPTAVTIFGAMASPPSLSQKPSQQQHPGQQQHQLLLEMQQQQQLQQQQGIQQQTQGGFPGFSTAMTSVQSMQQYPPSQPSPNLVDAGLLAQAQRAAEVERQARENLRHQADQAIRQEHERHRALMTQCEQLAASAAAAQAALLESQRREAAYVEEVKALRLAQQAKDIEERWREVTVRRCVGKWREAMYQRKRHQEFLRQQLARVSVNFNGGWAHGPLGLSRRGCGGGDDGGAGGRGELETGYGAATAGEPAPTDRKRRFLSSGAGPSSSSPSVSSGASALTFREASFTSHLDLQEVVLPGLCRALARSQSGVTAAADNRGVNRSRGQAASGLRNLRYSSLRGAAAAAKTGFRQIEDWELGNRKWSDPALQRHVFWKLLLVSGAEEPEAHCVSGYQIEAGNWIRDRLSCGRTAGARPHRNPQMGDQLTIEGFRVAVGDQACNLTLCVQDIKATCLAGYGVTSEASAVSVAATSGVMMLVDGRMLNASLAPGASPPQAAAEAAQDLDESWERLKRVLGSLPDTRPTQKSQLQSQGPSQLPLVIFTLGSAASVTPISSHLATAAAAWPSALAAKVLSSPAAGAVSLGAHVKVASLVEAPDDVLRQSLSYIAESAPLYDHVVTLDLEEVARGAVAEVVSEMDEKGAAVATAAATIAAFNNLLTVYDAAVQATAASPSARWGLPAPEVSASHADAAPACWAHDRVSTAVAELRRLQLPPPSPVQAGLPGGSAILPQLMGNVATWSATLTGPRKIMMLASMAPSLQRQLRARPSPPLGLQPPASTELLPSEAAVYGTPIMRPWVMAATGGYGSSFAFSTLSEVISTPAGANGGAGNGAPANHGGSTLLSASPPYDIMAGVMPTPIGPPMTHGAVDRGWSSGGKTPADSTSPHGFDREGNLATSKDGEMPPDPKRMATQALKNLLAALGA